jgi:ferredoxin
MNSAMESKQGSVGPAQAQESADLINVLRRFHYGEPKAVESTALPKASILPALLNPYRDASAIRYQYPLYLSPPGSEGDLARPVTEHFAAAVQEFALGPDDAKILRDNLPWIERYVRQKLTGPDPVDAPALFAEAAAAMQEHLGLETSSREKLEEDLKRLGEAVVEGSRFLAYGPDVALHLMLHAIRDRHESHRAAFHDEVAKRQHVLQDLLAVEASKSGEAIDPDAMKSSAGDGSRFLDAGALSGMLENRRHGSVDMSAERRERIEQALAVLQSWQNNTSLVRFVGKIDNPYFAAQPEVDVVASDDPCTEAGISFTQEAGQFARLFVAMRIAALEAKDAYDPAIHDSWFASFDWQAFSDEEMQLVTRIVALESADHLAGPGLPAFSKLLGSRLPVHVLSWVRAYDNPAAQKGEDPFAAYRFELANFGVGHRQVVVAQTSAARHEDLLAGFNCALDSSRTSLHLVNRGTQSRVKQPLLDAWFVASAALESRAHPFLLVNPDAGDHAAQRVSFDGNPQPDSDWPIEKLEYRDPDGDTTEMELAFTFADYALLIPALHGHFRTVPAGYESEDFVTVDEYLTADDATVDRLVPFVWGIDDQGMLTRLVVSRALVFACRDRLNYWHTLQELAGVQNFYVEEAIERIIEEQQAALEAEREQLRKEHEEELENVRSEAAGEAMGQLVDVLMGADLSSMAAGATQMATMPAAAPARPEAPAGEEAEEAVAEAAPEEEAEEELSFDEPWLDTASCTTCDDCMGINKMMFAYNDDKQAYLRDVKAGPYADLVAAAEICPAKCIHPGKPLDPNEPGLDELIARAAPFN